MDTEIINYHNQFEGENFDLLNKLYHLIQTELENANSKVWHGHPVWFIDDNPIVGYSKLKAGVKLLFWSGASFNDELLIPGSGKFKDAAIIYRHADEINASQVKHWLKLANDIQWDYKNVVKRKGLLLPLKGLEAE